MLFKLTEWMEEFGDWEKCPDNFDAEVFIGEGESDWLCTVLSRNGCKAHLLQLGINDALKVVSETVQIVNKIIAFFGRSSKHTADLKQRTGGICLVKPNVTRWNSTFYSLERFLCPISAKENVTSLNYQACLILIIF